jgi:hypothetical protein
VLVSLTGGIYELRRCDLKPSFIKIGSDIQKLSGGIHIQTHSKAASRDYFYFLQNKGSRLKTILTSNKD